jgi:hypothetical protein
MYGFSDDWCVVIETVIQAATFADSIVTLWGIQAVVAP